MLPGAMLVWCGDLPRLETWRIPPDGLVLGRDLLEQKLGSCPDDRSSRSHTRLTVEGDRIRVADTGSRNGTFSNGRRMTEPTVIPPPCVLRTGRSVWMLVPDVRRYENISLQRRGRLVVGGTLDATCRALDAAAQAESNVVLHGPLTIGRELGASYARTIGGDVLGFVPESTKAPLERALRKRTVRTLVLELTDNVHERDLESLATWLETDLRVVTLVRDVKWLDRLPWDVIRRLGRRIDLPTGRFDELSTTVFDLVRDLAPDAKIHGSVIERCLMQLHSIDEDLLMHQLRNSLLHWRTTEETTLRGQQLELDDPDRMYDCIHPELMRPRRRPRGLAPERVLLPARPERPLVHHEASDANWVHRRLCSDGSCVGVVAPDGRCRVCKTPAPLSDSPYR